MRALRREPYNKLAGPGFVGFGYIALWRVMSYFVCGLDSHDQPEPGPHGALHSAWCSPRGHSNHPSSDHANSILKCTWFDRIQQAHDSVARDMYPVSLLQIELKLGPAQRYLD